MHLNTINSNFEGAFTTDYRTAQLGSIGRFSFLPTIIMPLYTAKDSIYRVRTLLDSGAGHSWIANGLLKYVNYTRMPAQKLTIATLNGSVNRKCPMVQVYFRTGTLVPIECFVLDDFVEHIMVYGLKDYLREETQLSEETISKIVDPAGEDVDHIKISLGTGLVLSNAAMALICPEQSTRLNLIDHRLIIESTLFGLTISGEIPQRLRENTKVVQAMYAAPKICENPKCSIPEPDVHSVLGYQRDVLEDEIKFLWEKDNLGIFSHEMHDNDLIAMQRLENSMFQLETGQFEIRLPFNDKLSMLETNRELARARTYRQLTEMANKENYRNLAIRAKEELDLQNYIEIVTPDMIPVGKVHYLPWRGILKADSDTTKLRIVMDASAKTSASAVSLNQCLYQGPNLIINLAKCLIRFMLNKYRCVADIEKAFLRILIASEDRDVLRFFWPADPYNPKSKLVEYRWKAVLFGSISSPFILASVLKRLITTNCETDYTKQALLNGIYVDNLLHSDNEEDKLMQFFTESRTVLDQGHFNLREWASNSKKVRFQAKTQDVLIQKKNVNALGLWWDQLEDTLSFKAGFKWDLKYTKRSALSFSNAVFDPLNWICPLHVQNRLLLRDLWSQKYAWDKSFHQDETLVKRWNYLRQNCFAAMDIKMKLDIRIRDETQIHVFTDASIQAYGAVLYLVTPKSREYPEGEVFMIKAKAKIVPVDKNPTEDTMPRWELASIVVGAKLLVFVLDAVPQLIGKPVFIWNDNKPSLCWCSQTTIKDTYVHNRVKDIREKCPTATLRYVPTDVNPADILTRDITAQDLKKCRRWWYATEWITDQQNWPITEQIYNLHPPVLPQHANVIGPNDTPVLSLFSDHRFTKSLRALAFLIRWRDRHSKAEGTREYFQDNIGAEEMAKAKTAAVKIMQQNAFQEELRMLKNKGMVDKGKCKKLRLFLDEKEIIRCQSRVEFTLTKAPHKAPILMDTQNGFTKSYIKNIHVANNCAPYHFTLNAARQEIHGIKLQNLVKKVIGECKICIRYRAHPYRYPIQPVLPMERAQVDSPFTACAVDYCGPFSVLEENGTKKVWVSLFCCMVTRAVYIVLVDDLKSTTFLAALTELATRRAQPKVIVSDNMTTYTHGNKILTHIANQPQVKRELASLGIEWRWTPAKASWAGGIYERLVGIIKKELYKMCGSGIFTREDFRCHLIKVEHVVNSRPLCRGENQEILTPNHILNGSGEIRGTLLHSSTADEVLDQVLEARRDLPKHYQQIKVKKDLFWRAFQEQYLETLRFTQDKMGNSFKAVPKVGDRCLIYSPDEPRYVWKVAVVQSKVISKDGECRSCVIKTDNGITTRPTNHLFRLEMDLDDENEAFLRNQQAERSERHAGPLKELKKRMANEARASNLPEEDIQTMIQKLKEDLPREDLNRRPRRTAAINAAALRKQMIEDNAL